MPFELINPLTVHKPVGQYSHAAVVKAGTDLIYISGQVGANIDGRIGATLGEQADLAFGNLAAILKGLGLGAQNLVKVNIYLVTGHRPDEARAARAKHFGGHAPASTFVYVPNLVTPEYFIEVEAVAARN